MKNIIREVFQTADMCRKIIFKFPYPGQNRGSGALNKKIKNSAFFFFRLGNDERAMNTKNRNMMNVN